MTSPWNELIRAGLVGTDAQEPPAGLLDGLAPELAAGVEGLAPAARLLRMAGILSTLERAQSLPVESGEPPSEPANDDPRPVCSPRAAQILADLVESPDQSAALISIWLRRAGECRRRVPAQLLPALLGFSARNTALRSDIRAVVGPRGQWLAAMNPAWSAQSGAAGDERTWQEGPRAARVAHLKDLREADPARARALLETTWSKESARERLEFIEVLESRLSMEDEPFLDAALDDRGREVRTMAANLLRRLPGSRLVGRMIERAGRLVSMDKGWLRGLRIEVRLPESLPEDWLRDGMVDDPPAGQKRQPGEIYSKQSVLGQVLGAVPPSWWESCGEPPGRIITAIQGSDFASVLLPAVFQAAMAHRDQRWLMEFLRPVAAIKGLGHRDAAIGLLGQAEREEVIMARLKEGRAAARPLLHHLSGEWSRAVSELVISHVVEPALAELKTPSYDDAELYPIIGLRLSSACADRLDALAPGIPEITDWRFRNMLEKMLETYRLRLEIHREIHP